MLHVMKLCWHSPKITVRTEQFQVELGVSVFCLIMVLSVNFTAAGPSYTGIMAVLI